MPIKPQNSSTDTAKADFNEALSYLVETANINGGHLSKAEIHHTLDGLLPDASMYEMVYQYMKEKKITVEGVTEASLSDKVDSSFHESSASTDTSYLAAGSSDPEAHQAQQTINRTETREQEMIDLYLNEIDGRLTVSAAEEYDALLRCLSTPQDKTLQNLLTEMNVARVLPIANEFRYQGVPYGDLIQEGNLGLIEGIMTFLSMQKNDSFSESAEVILDRFHHHLSETIHNAMKDCIAEQDTSVRIGIHAAERANELDRASITLSKKLDRAPTLAELADFVALSEDEVERILKMSLNAMQCNEMQ